MLVYHTFRVNFVVVKHVNRKYYDPHNYLFWWDQESSKPKYSRIHWNGKSVSKLTLLTLSCPDIFTTSGPQNGRCQQLPSLHSTLLVFMCLEAFRIHAFNFFFIHMFKTLFVIRFDLVVATLVLNQLSLSLIHI